jgi:ceramide glucosyltransferase
LSLLALVVFYFLAAISIWLGLVSLHGGIRFVRYLRSELVRDYPEFTPFISVFVPCRGVDEGLKENVVAIFSQAYPSFEVVLVADRADDPALEIIEDARRSFTRSQDTQMRVVIAGSATDTGQKVHNLRTAVAEADPKSEVFVFVDTDAQPEKTWLQHLVRPLRDDRLGATTGYRWFVPSHGGFAAHLRSVWNASIASALGAAEAKNFCWGGSTAIRRTSFAELRVTECWRGAVSDDFTLTNVLHRAGRPIKFVPQCLTPSYESCGLRELFEFTTRQLKITRTYAPHLWRAVLSGSVIFVLTVGGGIALIIARALSGLSFGPPLLLLLVILLLGAMKSYLRLGVVAQVIPNVRIRSAGMTLAHVVLWPLASLLYLFNSLAAAGSRRISWRGITYELKSPTETVIIRHDSNP